ncbi:MAG: thioredoxin [Bacteroidetes bacterium]|nr:MAG: thioredoxin [Bacteroidota bacterium]
MNRTFIHIILFILLGFSHNLKAQDTLLVNTITDSIYVDTIQYNQVILDTNIDKAILIGYCTEEGLSSSPIFSSCYKKEYDQYQPNLVFLKSLTELLQSIHITVIFGSWCSDSQREVPRLMRILDEMNFPLDSLSIIGVNRLKTVPNIDISRYMIEFVPTIIFSKSEFEIGRIVESPLESLEDDMASILMKIFLDE